MIDDDVVPLDDLTLRGLTADRLDDSVEFRLLGTVLLVQRLSLRDFLSLVLELVDNGIVQPFRRFQRIELCEQHDLFAAGLTQTAAKLEHGGRLSHHCSWQVIVNRGEFAIDIIEKSQEPTSYFLFLFTASATCRHNPARWQRVTVISNILDKITTSRVNSAWGFSPCGQA